MDSAKGRFNIGKGVLVLLLSACWMMMGLSCRRAESPQSSGKAVSVFVSIAPQAEFVRRIGGNRVRVEILVKSGQSPATFSPSARQMARLSQADVLFCIGVPFETTLRGKIQAAMPNLNIVETQQGITRRKMQGEGHSGHGGGDDPHIWMNPRLVKKQAATICHTLAKIDPAHKAEYAKHLEEYQADLDRLDARVAKALAPLAGRTIYVYHPAFGYFTDAYGLKQKAAEIEGKAPSAKQLTRLIAAAKKDGVKTIFVQPQFPAASADALAKAIGGAVVPLDPLAEDYMKNIERIAEKIEAALVSHPN
ncbi:MAG: zinc ABC transporter substrate-binding protein [Phycisphaerae bacterium]|nr:zinc ABC transporter substrate-binding protein [Phycisphaerae bacterium]